MEHWDDIITLSEAVEFTMTYYGTAYVMAMNYEDADNQVAEMTPEGCTTRAGKQENSMMCRYIKEALRY